MFGKECTLCGGRLDNNNVCTECGLDNTKSDKNYHMNESSCDHMPLTHVHEDKEDEDKDVKETKNTGKYNQARPAGKKDIRQTGGWQQAQGGWNRNSKKNRKSQSKGAKVITVLTIIITVAGILFNILEDHKSDITSWAENTLDSEGISTGDGEHYDYDPYAYVERSIPEEGESAEYMLPCGNYLVGIHIPEGIYTVIPGNDYDAVNVKDPDNSIYLYEYVESRDETIEDIRLYKGALLTVQCKDTVTIQTGNAQSQDMAGTDNPLTETVYLSDEKSMAAGREFPEGIYDLKRVGGNGPLSVIIYDQQGQELSNEIIGMYEGGDNQEYRYLVLPKGASVKVDSDLSISMTPSEVIESGNYLSFYEKYR